MEIYRFDPELGIPVSRFGSRFTVNRLTGLDSRVVVQVLHLPAHGLIGRHPAVARQLLAVVTGSGLVSGGDGERRAIAVGQAALWEPGEEHETTSEDGLVAVCIEGEFDVEAFLVTKDIVVRDYDSEWPRWFDRICDYVRPAVEGVAIRIDHVGSTSVPGLAAKPIIDMDVVVSSDDEVGLAVERLAGLGYGWRGDLGITGRQAFFAPTDVDLPAHHLYVVVEDNKAHLDHWLLRDTLCADPESRDRYAQLKRDNADAADRSIDRYLELKAGFVEELLARARRERGLPSVS